MTDLLQWVGLGDRMHAYPSVLSGGEKQRAAIARAVIGKPELLLADEPTGNVDPQMARRLLRLFIELNRLGTSVVIATHDHQLMRQYKAPRLELHMGLLTMVCLARAGSVLFWSVRPEVPGGSSGSSAQLLLPTLALLAMSVLMSAFAAPIQRYTAAAALQLTDRAAYARAVLPEQGGAQADTTRPYRVPAEGKP